MIIGIDLGTTFSVGAYADENGVAHVLSNRDGSNTTPSVVMFDEDEILVGIQAKNNASLSPSDVIQFVKRNMGNPEWFFLSAKGEKFTAEEISSLILKRIKEDCEEKLGEPVTEAVITVPAYFSDAQRQATIDAGKLAGLKVKAIINEPTAAAIAYGIDKLSEPQKVMVYDLGGGTCDVTIINISSGEIKVLATHGNRNLGGKDFDDSLIEYISQQFKASTGLDINEDDEANQILRGKCEEAKIALSSREKFKIALSVMGKKFDTTVTREKFEELISILVNETKIDVDIALEDSRLKPSDIDKVLLVGGSTRIPAVREFIEKRMNIKPSAELNPDEVVAIGAAIYARTLTQKTGGGGKKEDPVVIKDVNSHALGVVALMRDENGREYLANSVIIPRNQSIPSKGEKEYYTHSENTTELQVQVTEGDDEDLEYVTIVGEALIHINPHPENSPVRVELGHDRNGVITCKVFDVTDNCYIGDVEFKRKDNLSEDEVKSKTLKMNQISVN